MKLSPTTEKDIPTITDWIAADPDHRDDQTDPELSLIHI